MDFMLGDVVKVINGPFAGKIGIIKTIYPIGTMSWGIVAMIQYENSNNSGMFEVEDLMLMK